MITKGQDDTYDITGYGLGEGLMLCHKYELIQLMLDIQVTLNGRGHKNEFNYRGQSASISSR